MNIDIDVVRQMRTTIEEQAELIIQLKRELYGRGWVAPQEFRLTPQEDRFLAYMVAHPGVREHETLFEAIDGGGATQERQLVNVVACKVRTKLARFGIGMITHYRRGYSLPEHDRQRLLHWNERRAA